jgi:hypothetical protein
LGIPKVILKHGVAENEEGYKSTFIKPHDTVKDVFKKATNPQFEELKNLHMKFWIKQINPDILDYRKKPVIENPVEVDYSKYPSCIKNCMNLKDKPPKVRYLLMKYLLLMHKREDAKGVLLGCLNETEIRALDYGKLEEQWSNVINNLDYNMEPTCEQLRKEGVCSKCERVSPFEEVIK